MSPRMADTGRGSPDRNKGFPAGTGSSVLSALGAPRKLPLPPPNLSSWWEMLTILARVARGPLGVSTGHSQDALPEAS